MFYFAVGKEYTLRTCVRGSTDTNESIAVIKIMIKRIAFNVAAKQPILIMRVMSYNNQLKQVHGSARSILS